MTPTRLAAAQRHSPGSRPVRSSQDIFNVGERKTGMSSDQRTLPAMAIQLGELLTNTKGGKSLPLRREGGPVVWQSAEVQKILWQPSAYNDADAKRVPICLEAEETAAQELEEIEQQVTQLLSQQSQSDTKIFGKALAPHEVEARLQSCRKTSARGNSFLKFKLNWDRVRVWDASGQELQEFGDLAGRSCKVRVELRQCWLMPPSWGILMEVTDLMLMEAAPPQIQCPF